MTKEVPWIELLDSFVKRALQQNVLLIEHEVIIQCAGNRWGRMENMQYLFGKLKDFIETSPAKALVLFSRKELLELRWAYEQFSTFDYSLIKLCYGQLSQHIYLMRYSRFMQKELNSYLVHRDSEAVERLFAIANGACDDTRGDKTPDVAVRLEKYSALIEEAWVHSLLR